MFGDIFDDDQPSFDTNAKNHNSHDNCASGLTIPEPQRNEANFVGLYNQGGTCYLNSSLQMMYMTPLFRKMIFSLPLCESSLSSPSSFIPVGQKYNVLLSLQKLFAEMNDVDIIAMKTTNLTGAFNWEQGEGAEQQDSQEFYRLLLFDILERILMNTSFNTAINTLYQVGYVSIMKCSQCGNERKRNENEYVLPVTVFDMKSLNEGLQMSFGHEETIEGYKCENCNQKVDLVKTSRIISLPQYLNLGLNRFTFSYETCERVKITSKFEFPLEINMKKNCDDSIVNIEGINEEDFIYELYGVIVHAGTPYGGHYFAYIRDMTAQGKWKVEKEIKKEEKKEEKPKEEKKDDTKKGKKNKKKQNKKEKDEEVDKTDYDDKDYPIPYTNKDLGENWYEFNDSIVTPIKVGRLQKVFKSQTSAYMLFYSKKTNPSINHSSLTPPEYLQKYTNELNANLTIDRSHYEEEKNSLLINIYTKNDFSIYESKTSSHFISVNNNAKGCEKKIKFSDKLSTVFPSAQPTSSIVLFDYDPVSRLVTILKVIPFTVASTVTISEVEMYHKCNIVLIDSLDSDDIFIKSKIRIGNENEPIFLKMYHNGTKFNFACYLNDTFDDLKNLLKENLNTKEEIEISFTNPSGKEITLDSRAVIDKSTKKTKTIKALNLHNKQLITVTTSSVASIAQTSSLSDTINCLVKFEDDDDEVNVISMNIKDTFEKLHNDILTLCKKKNNTEGDIAIRLRVEMTNKLIQKSEYIKPLSSSPMFVEGDVRIKVEYGDVYEEDECLITIMMKNALNIVVSKTFIGKSKKVTIQEMKKTLVKALNEDNKEIVTEQYTEIKADEMTLFKVDAFDDPVKAIKNESQTLDEVGIKDKEHLWMRLNKDLLSNMALIFVYKSEVNFYDTGNEHFIPVDIDDSKSISNMTVAKKTTISELKVMINDKIDINKIRLRLIGKYNQPERILKNENTLSKYNVESPVRILYEELPTEETLTENEMFIVLMKRDIKNKQYTDKTIIKVNSTITSDKLYEQCREYIKAKNISIAKHIRGMYMWEAIREYDDKGKAMNLRKGQITIRDSDWIGVRNDDEEDSSKDDFNTEFDVVKYNKKIEEAKIKGALGKKGKRNIVEKPLRINIDD